MMASYDEINLIIGWNPFVCIESVDKIGYILLNIEVVNEFCFNQLVRKLASYCIVCLVYMCYFMYRLRIIACLFLEYAPCKLVFFFFFANCCQVIKYLSKKKSCKWIIHCNFNYIPEAEIKTHCLHSTSACYVPCKINYPCYWLKDQATHWVLHLKTKFSYF